MYLKIIKIFAILLAICIIVPGNSALGQNKSANAKEIITMIQKYVKSEVLPKLKDLKAEFDKGLSEKDLNTLNELRTKAKALRTQIIEIRKTMREAKRAGDWERFDTNKDKLQQLQDQMLNLAQNLKPIAENNKDLLINIGKKAKPLVKVWSNDIQELFSSWMKEHKSELNQRNINKYINKFKNIRHNQFGSEYHKKRTIARFMLWDGSDDFLNEFDEIINNFENDFNQNQIHNINKRNFDCYNYPNPFSDRTKFSFYLPEDENVVITFSDNTGKELGNIYKGKLPAGEHIIYFEPGNTDFKNLNPGIYYYKIQAGKWNKSGKMIFGK